jgi:hypothetical protein
MQGFRLNHLSHGAIACPLQNLRPGREKKIAAAITPTEELILSLICRVSSSSVSQSSLLRELHGIRDARTRLNYNLGRLRLKGCIVKQGREHFRTTGRGRRVAAILSVAKSKRGSN